MDVMKTSYKIFGVGGVLRVVAYIAFLLLLLFVGLWTLFDFDVTSLYNLFFVAILLSTSLVVVSVIQSFKVAGSASIMAEELAKEMMNSSQNLFIELYRKSPVPYILINQVGMISSTNIASLRLFGVGAGKLDGQNVFNYIIGDNEDHIGLISSKFAEGLSITDEEVRIKHSDGSSRWVILSIFSFNDDDDKRQGFLTLVDITKQKNVDRAKSEFVSLASHQLRTPITAMKWSLELFFEKSKGEISEEQMKYLDKVESNLKRMNGLINDFLSVSKFELGTYSRDLTQVSLTEVIDDLIDENLPRIETKNVTINKEINGEVDTIMTDLTLIRMIIGNLMSNAIKYSHANSTVDINVARDSDETVITVTDSGMGIPVDDQEMLFTKMFRASNARRDVPDGTGLGLYIVQSAVKTLGGQISFESFQDRGTMFRVVLPN